MGFLAPLWFLLGAAAVVPLLVHLLRRRSGATTEFPAARYLLRAEREHSRSIRLRNLLLMLLRVLAMLLLTIAAARPVGRLLGAAGGGHAPTALAIVLDNSLSTSVVEQGRPAFERLRDAARSVLERADPGDRIHLVTVDGRARGGTRESALVALGEIIPFAGAGDVVGAIRRAEAAALAGSGLAPRVLVLTDGQRTSWDAPMELGDRVPVVVSSLESPPVPNRGVAAAEPRPPRWTPAGVLTIRLHARDSTPVRVLMSPAGSPPRTVARALAAPGEALAVRATAADSGLLVGRVEIDGDELPGDDVRHFALWASAAPRVAVLPGAGPFARSAIDAIRETGAIRDGDGMRVLAADEIRGWRGPMVILAPASPAALGAANAALGQAGIPWRLGAVASAGSVRAGSALRDVAVRRSHVLVPAAAARVDTLATIDGRPWAVAGVANGTRYVVIASPLLPDATDLPVRAAFVPWLATLVTGLAGPGGEILRATPAQSLRRPAEGDSLVHPGGDAIAIADEAFAAPEAPGVYVLRRAGQVTGAVVVNVEESESVMDRMQGRELAARIRGPEVEAVSMGSGLVDRAFATVGTRSLVAPVLMAVLLVLAVEAFVTAFRTRGAL